MTIDRPTDSAPAEPSGAPVGPARSTRWIALGVLLLQLTWVFAVPPFRGSDEFDHVYRAAAAARGQWFVAPAKATRGTGAWLDVPTDIVRAARPHCEELPYTHDEDCVGTPSGNSTRIASGAGRYHPLFYVLAGVPALPFDGDNAVYMMRLATALMAWLLFCLAVGATRRWATTSWPMAALALACTPVLIYSCSIVAPNGVEMMAGLALWSSLLGLLQDPDRPNRYLMVATSIAGAVLVTTRSLGPMWCLLILIAAVIATRPTLPHLTSLARQRAAWVTSGVVLAATLMSATWTLKMHALNIGQEIDKHISTGHRWHLLLQSEPLWMLQTIAAFPNRDEQTRMPVYACYLILYAVITWFGFRHGRRPVRLALAFSFAIAVLVPFASGLNPNTYPGLWQGRYGLPFAVGIAVLTGFALETSPVRLNGLVRVAVLPLFVTAHAISPADVFDRATQHRLSDYGDFIHPPVGALALVAAMCAGTLWWGATSSREFRGGGPEIKSDGIPHG